jgi:hypothetical protein
MLVHLLAPSAMDMPTPPEIDAEKQAIVVTPNLQFKTAAPMVIGYVRVEGSNGAARKYVLLVSPVDGTVTATEHVPVPAAFDKLTAEELQKKSAPRNKKKKKTTAAT